MTPAAIIAQARADGIVLSLAPDGGLAFRGPRAAAEKWVPRLRASKPGIVAHLRRARRENESSEDWRAFYDERAALFEYDGGLPRLEAETRAFEATVAEWLRRAWTPSSCRICASCRRSDGRSPLLPFGTKANGHIWLHQECWKAWHQRRRAEAIASLAGLGIPAPKDPDIADSQGWADWARLGLAKEIPA